jgi:decaprenyl-phosphate phosphoribosyltransferase
MEPAKHPTRATAVETGSVAGANHDPDVGLLVRGRGTAQALQLPQTPSLRGHLEIARVDHWTKNVFVLPGILIAGLRYGVDDWTALLTSILLGLLSVGLVASSNYTLNEVIDAPFDRNHPSKRHRPVASGRVHVPLAYGQWLALGAVGMAIGYTISTGFLLSMVALWVMGCIYNVPPIRAKDVPYVDVLTEAINNPLRFLAGWYLIAGAGVAPATLLLSYWMIGCYFMAIKRYAECRQIADRTTIAAYRRSLAFFTPERLLISIMFYGSAAMLFFGAFIMRYRLELILSFPLVALVMAQYLDLGFRNDSAAQNPEKLYRETGLMIAVIACAAAMVLLLIVQLDFLHAVIESDFVHHISRSLAP